MAFCGDGVFSFVLCFAIDADKARGVQRSSRARTGVQPCPRTIFLGKPIEQPGRPSLVHDAVKEACLGLACRQ